MTAPVAPFRVAADLPLAVAAVREALARGEVVAVPTESSYGLAVRPDDLDAVARVFDLKGRDAGKALLVIAGSVEQAEELVEIADPWRERLGGAWPAPLTAVLPARRPLPAGGATLAVRVPAHVLLRRLLLRVGPLTATSANRAGEPPAESAADVVSALGDSVGLILDGGRCPGGAPSTLVDCCVQPPRVLRAGAWTPDPAWGLKTV